MDIEADRPIPARTSASEPARNGLDRLTILGAAVDLIDQEGIRGLTMRRLGTRLGVEAMTLYGYVPSREELLDGVVDLVIDGLYTDPEVRMSAPPERWQEYLERVAHGVRRIALAHPQVFPLVATRPPAAPWLRPPLRSLRWTDSFLETMLERGFSDRAAVAAYRAFSSFLLGHLLLEVSGLGVETGPEPGPSAATTRPTGRSRSALEEYPHLRRLGVELSVDGSANEFAESLTNLLSRLEALVR